MYFIRKRAATIRRKRAILNDDSTFDVVRHPTPPGSNNDDDIIWKDIYLKWLLAYKNYYQLLGIIPYRVLKHFMTPPSSVFEHGLTQLPTNESGAFYRLRDIWMPIVENGHAHWIDTMTQYLLQLDTDREYGLLELLTEGPYEYKQVALRKGDVVVDAGVCLGDFSLLAAHKSGPNGRVIGFEPSRHIIDSLLQPAIVLNQAVSDRIEIAPYALSDRIGTIDFNYDPGNPGLGRIESALDAHSHMKTETINAITLDEYVHRMNLPKIDFIKADIEGAERHMLRGATGVLRDFAPRLALCTYHLPDDPQVLEQIVLDANPEYKITHKYLKMYAYVPD